MPYQNNVSTLADVVGTPFAAYQAGADQGNEQQQMMLQNELAQRTMQQKVDAATLANQTTAAQLPGLQGISQQQQAAGQVAQQTAGSTIGAKNASNQTVQSAQQLEQLNQLGQVATNTAALMEQTPPAARPALMQQIAAKYQIDTSAMPPQLAQGDPTALRAFAGQLALHSQDFMQKQALQTQKETSEQSIAAGNNATTLVGKQMDNETKNQVAALRAQATQMKMSTDQRIAQLSQQAAQYQSQGQPVPAPIQQELQSLASFKASLAPALGPQLVGDQPVNTPTQRASGAFNYNQQAPSTDVSNTDAIKTAVTQAGQQYEPDKYMYRIGPSGQLQRKPK